MVSTIGLVNISHLQYSGIVFLLIKTCKRDSLSSFPVYTAVLPTVVAVRPQDFLYLKVCAFDHLSRLARLCSPPLPLAATTVFSVPCEFVWFLCFCVFKIPRRSEVMQDLAFSDFFHVAECRQGPCALKQGQDSVPSCG